MPHKAPILNVPKSIREDDSGHYENSSSNDHQKSDEQEADYYEDDDLIFGALEDDHSSRHSLDRRSPSADEGIQIHGDKERVVKRERANSSISTVDEEWDHMMPITEGDGLGIPLHHFQSIHEGSSVEPIIGMSNFRVKHRLRRRSRTTTIARWREAVKKVVQLKDPW